jgi:hypothetical protein
MRGRRGAGLLALLLWAPTLLAAVPASAEPIVPGLTVMGPVIYRDTSFILTGDIVVGAGGSLTLDHSSIIVKMAIDEGVSIRVDPGGEFKILNGSRITSAFGSVGFALRYKIWTHPAGHFEFRDSTVDFAYWIGVGDENAIIDNVTISHSMIGLFGYNLTATRVRLLDNNMGFWLSGHSLIRDVVSEGAGVYAGLLDGTSRLENGALSGSTVADMALLDNASTANTTHRGSGRGFILYGNPSVTNATINDMIYGGVQLGEVDFRYGCGLFVREPIQEWLNLHLFNFYHRVNNSVSLTDISVTNSTAGVYFARPVWRADLNASMPDDCQTDPPFQDPGPPLTNEITWIVTRPTRLSAGASHFNGTLRILPGGELALQGGSFTFVSDGNSPRIDADGDALSLQGVRMSSALVDYAGDRLITNHSLVPGVDIAVNAGSLVIEDSLLQDIGTTASTSLDTGIVVGPGAGAVTLRGATINESRRGLLLGCCAGGGATALIDRSTIDTAGPSLQLFGATADVFNSTLRSDSSSALYASSGASAVRLYATAATLGGPASVSVEKFGGLVARVVWQDLRPIGGATVAANAIGDPQPAANLTTAQDGFTNFQFVSYRTSLWDGSGETVTKDQLFIVSATRDNYTAFSPVTDISQGVVLMLVIPDGGRPTVALDMPFEFFSNNTTALVSGVAQDLETGVSLVELSIDGGPYQNITVPGLPVSGPLRFSKEVVGLANGLHALAVRAWDSVGNTGDALAFYIVDQRPPGIFLDFPFNLLTATRNITVSGRLSEPGWVTVGGNTSFVDLTNGTFALPLYLERDSETVGILVRDLAGNEQTYFFVATLDELPPELTIKSPASGTCVSTPRVIVVGRLEAGATLSLNEVALSVSGGPNEFSLSAALSEGDNMLSLMATDLAGNPNRIDLLVCLDTGFPLLEVIAPDFSRPFDHGNLTVVLRTETGALVSVGNTTVTALSAIVEVPVDLEDGRTVLLISAADRAGNTVRKSEIVNIDSRFPTLEVRGGTSQATANATFRLNGQTEPNAFVRVGDFEGQADSLGVFAVTLRLRPGANTVRVTSWDAAGNTVSTTVDIAVSQPPGTAPAGFAAPELAGVALLIVGAAAAALAVPTVRFMLGRRG